MNLYHTLREVTAMFERFTDRSRRIIVRAQEEAQLLNHCYIGTEHLLLGLLREAEGIAGKVLTGTFGIELQRARDEVEKEVPKGEYTPTGHIPFTPRCKKVLELATREALRLDENYIEAEHLLLGLLRQEDALGVKLLQTLEVSPNDVRQGVYDILRIEGRGVPVQEKKQEGVAMSSLTLTELNYYIEQYEATLTAMKARREELEASSH